MAFAALVSLAQTVDQILNRIQHYSFSVHEKQQTVAIHEYVIFLEAFLEHFPERAKNLEGRFREVANEAEDVLENLMLEQTGSRNDAEFKEQLKRVAEEFEAIAGQVMEIKNSFRDEGVQSVPADSSSSRLAPTTKDVMVGFDEDLLAIKTRICGESTALQVVPIVGMAGIGKTTLARNAYNDPFVMEYFDIRIWVTVSQDYSAHEILSGLLAPMKDFNRESYGQRKQEEEEEKVYKRLKGRRYLIIMDDIWNTEAWDIVRNVFPDDNNGSRIIVTTRLSSVAAYPGSRSSAHEMLFMNADQSWDLLRQRVFAGQDCPPELQGIGKMIAKNCKGLPLAIVVVAGLLSVVSKSQTAWKKIAKKVDSVLTGDHEQIDEILSLSYTHLPHHLRPCFLYLGGFPEDSEIRVSKLIRLWVAEGFLKCQNELKSLEEEAEEYLEDLVKRNLVLISKRKSNGKIKSCSLHDLMRDLCIRKGKEEEFIVHLTDHSSTESSIKNPRRITVTRRLYRRRLLSYDFSSTHTMILLESGDLDVDHSSLSLLRVLECSWRYLLKELFHLRYLALDSYIGNMFNISRFQNLQTLIIKESGGWRVSGVHDDYLPHEIWMMKQLRHVLICGRLHDPNGRALQKLQTLSLMSHYICTEATLKMIPKVKKLGLCCSAYPGGNYLNNLVHLHHLENLALYSHDRLNLRKSGVAFPNTLKKLSLARILIPWDDLTIVGSLPNLQVFKLREMFAKPPSRTWETNEGEFLQLEFLLIDSPNLRHWITESSHFPRLKSLLLHDCHLLRDIPADLGEIPTLELIEVRDFNGINYLGRQAKRIQEEQHDFGNYSLQVRYITR